MARSIRRAVAVTILINATALGTVMAQDEAVVKRQTQLRAQPSEGAPGLAELPANSVLIRSTQRHGAWLHVKTQAGTSGWVSMFDIGAPVRDLVVGLLRRVVSKPSAGTVATATIGIRGFGHGSVPVGGAVPRGGAAGLDMVTLAEKARVGASEAREFAGKAGFQVRMLNALPVPALPTGVESDVMPGSVHVSGDSLLARALRAPEALSEPEEVELGRMMAAVLLQGQPVDLTPGMQSYVNHLGRWLSLQSSRPSLPWTFVVVDEADFQAFSVPGGYVFVSRGVVDRCADEAELAGLIAHEIAHVAQRHGLKAMQRIAAVDSTQAASLADLTHRVQRYGAGVTAEFEADRLAVAIVARAGLDSFGLMAALVQQNTLNDSDLHYAEAHPQSRLRLDQLEAAMAHTGQLSGQVAVPVHVPQRLAAFISR